MIRKFVPFVIRTMNYLDIILCIPLIWGLYKGFSKGFILEIFSIVAFVGGIYIAVRFSDLVAEKLKTSFENHSQFLPIISFAIVFLGVVIAVYFIGKMIQKMAEAVALGLPNKLAGAVFGALKYALLFSVLIFLIESSEKYFTIIPNETKTKSFLYTHVKNIAPFLIPKMKELSSHLKK